MRRHLTKAPLNWYGGKLRMSTHLLRLIPPHKVYVEAFGGGGALLFAKSPAGLEVHNDLDEGLVNFFRVLRDPTQYVELQRLLALTPYARSEFTYAREQWRHEADSTKRAHLWYIVARQAFSGGANFRVASWSSVTSETYADMPKTCFTWLAMIRGLPEFHARLMRVQIENQDWRVILDRYDSPDTFFYLDPPYVLETRQSARYEYELTRADHEELAERLLALDGKVLLSGYATDAYLPLEAAGWFRLEYPTTAHAAGRTSATGLKGKGSATRSQKRTEIVWASYDPHGIQEPDMFAQHNKNGETENPKRRKNDEQETAQESGKKVP